MRKGTLFLSATLTTFMLAILFGAAYAYQTNLKSTQNAVAQATATDVAPVENVSNPLPTTMAVISPQDAAALAGQVIGHTDAYSVETTTLNGTSVYLVTFSSGDLVYVSPSGQILSVVAAQPTASAPVVILSNGTHRKGGSNNSSSPQPSSGGEHEGGGHDD